MIASVYEIVDGPASTSNEMVDRGGINPRRWRDRTSKCAAYCNAARPEMVGQHFAGTIRRERATRRVVGSFFKKKGKLTVVRISIKGTVDHPSFGLAL